MIYANIIENNLLNETKFSHNFDKIFIFIVNLNINKFDISKLYKCLSYNEQNRAKQYFTNNLSNSYIVCHGILRYILGYYTKDRPQDIEFIYNKYGKPFLKKNENNIQFNISHSHELITYIIAINHTVGIDIEFHNNIPNIEELSNLVFSPSEYEFFLNFKNRQDRVKFFFDLWTKKESLIKACGLGLSYPINSINVIGLTAGKKFSLSMEKDFSEHDHDWYHYPLEVKDGYSGSIAINHKIKQIAYLEINNKNNIFNQISLKYFD